MTAVTATESLRNGVRAPRTFNQISVPAWDDRRSSESQEKGVKFMQRLVPKQKTQSR